MAIFKSYTNIEQGRKLAEILPLKSADMHWQYIEEDNGQLQWFCFPKDFSINQYNKVSAWSLAALLKYLSEIKPQVYIPLLFPSEGKWILQFVEYGHGNVCEVSCDNPVDACYEIIIRLDELNLLGLWMKKH